MKFHVQWTLNRFYNDLFDDVSKQRHGVIEEIREYGLYEQYRGTQRLLKILANLAFTNDGKVV